MIIATSTKKIWALYFFLASIFSVMSVLKYQNLNSTYFDFGVFLNNCYMVSLGHWQRIFVSHVQPFSFIFSLPYQLSPSLFPVFLLAIQSALLALPIIGLNKHYGLIPALAFLLYFPIWYIALFDFHIDHLAIPLLFAFFFFEREGKITQAIIMAISLAFVKEIFSLQAAFCGIFLILSRKKWTAGILLFSFGMVYFYFAVHYFQRYFGVAPLMDHLLLDLSSASLTLKESSTFIGKSEIQIVTLIITNLPYVLWEIISNPDKIKYLIYLFGAVGCISFLSLRTLVVLLPILSVNLFFENKPYYGHTNHYTAGLIAPIIIAFAEGLPIAKEYWTKMKLPTQSFTPIILSGLVFAHILISPSPIGRYFYLKESNLNYNIYKNNERNVWIKSKILKFIPSDPNIIISIQNSINFDHIINRKNVFVFPDGSTKSTPIINSEIKTWSGFWEYIKNNDYHEISHEFKLADYVILDLKKPWFINDKGCRWVGTKCTESKIFEEKFILHVNMAKKVFDTVYDKDQFLILKRSSNSQSLL